MEHKSDPGHVTLIQDTLEGPIVLGQSKKHNHASREIVQVCLEKRDSKLSVSRIEVLLHTYQCYRPFSVYTSNRKAMNRNWSKKANRRLADFLVYNW